MSTMKKKIKTWAVQTAWFLGVLALSLMAADAWGQELTLEQIQAAAGGDDDVGLRLLSGIFGEAFVANPFTAGVAQSTLIGGLMYVFNSAIFLLGVSWLGWNIVVTIANGAHRGSPEGDGQNSALWTPIRNGVGIVMMIPALGGFSIAQGLMMLSITWGVGLANIVTDEFLTRSSQMQAIVPSFASAASAPNLSSELHVATRGLFISELCHQAQLYQHETFPDTGSRAPQMRDFMKRNEVGFDYGECGRVTVTRDWHQDERVNEGAQSLTSFRNAAVDYDAIASEAHTAAWGALMSIQRQVRLVAKDWLAGNGKIDDDQRVRTTTLGAAQPISTEAAVQRLDQIEIKARADLNGAIAAETGGYASAIQAEVLEGMRQSGWTMIGTYYSTFAEIGASIADAQKAWRIAYMQGTEVETIHRDGRLLGLTKPAIDKFLLQSQIIEREKPRGFIGGAIGVATDRNATGELSVGQNLLGVLIDAVAEDSGGSGLVNPVIASKNMGDYMMIAGQTAIIGGAVVGAKLPASKALMKGLDKATGGAVGMLKSAAYAMIGLGLFLSAFIPFLPVIIWFGALGVYLIACIEAITFAQLAAFQHMRSDGGDQYVTGSAAKYYIYLFNMLLRPSLLVIGFVFASAVMIGLGSLLIHVVGVGVAHAQGNSLTGALTILGYLVIFCVMLFTVVQTSLSACLIEMPNKMLGWLGAGVEAGANMLVGMAAGSALQGMRDVPGASGAAGVASATGAVAGAARGGGAAQAGAGRAAARHAT